MERWMNRWKWTWCKLLILYTKRTKMIRATRRERERGKREREKKEIESQICSTGYPYWSKNSSSHFFLVNANTVIRLSFCWHIFRGEKYSAVDERCLIPQWRDKRTAQVCLMHTLAYEQFTFIPSEQGREGQIIIMMMTMIMIWKQPTFYLRPMARYASSFAIRLVPVMIKKSPWDMRSDDAKVRR